MNSHWAGFWRLASIMDRWSGNSLYERVQGSPPSLSKPGVLCYIQITANVPMRPYPEQVDYHICFEMPGILAYLDSRLLTANDRCTALSDT